jgi:AP-1 complex subunit gamma-1
MPPPEIREEQRVLGQATGKSKRNSKLPARKKPSQITEQDMLLDLMGGDTGASPEAGSEINGTGQQHNADLLADILGGGNTVASPTSPIANGASASRPQQSNAASIMDLFDSQPSQPQQPQQQQRPPMPASSASNDILATFSSPSSPPPQQAHTAYNKNSLLLTFAVSRNAQAVQVQAKFRNTSSFESLGQVNLQAAVPKTQKLQLQAISTSELGPGVEAGQAMRVSSVQGVSFDLLILFVFLRRGVLMLIVWYSLRRRG